MENNLENKCRFFGIYYRQNVLTINNGEHKHCILHDLHHNIVSGNKLNLKNIKYLSDEVITEIAKINKTSFEIIKNALVDDIIKEFHYSVINITHTLDHLRINGYAVPWMGLSVEKMIEYDWIILD